MTATNNNLPPALEELIREPQTLRAQISYLVTADELLAEGLPTRSVVRGLASAIIVLMQKEYLTSLENFDRSHQMLRELEEGFGGWRVNLELVEDMSDSIIRSRRDGDGNPVQ